MKTESTSRLPLSKKLLFSTGDLSTSIPLAILMFFQLYFLTDVAGLPPAYAAWAVGISRLWDAVNDPLFGLWSDGIRTRWGRRRPYLLFSALPFALTFAMLWWIPPFDNVAALAVYYAVAFALFDTAASFAYMPFYALTPELTSDYDERTGLTSTRMFFSIFASLVAFTLPLAMVSGFYPENADQVLVMGAVLGTVSAITLLVVFFGTRERKEFVHQERSGFFESIKSSFKNRPFVFGLLLFLTGIAVFTAASLIFESDGWFQEWFAISWPSSTICLTRRQWPACLS